MTKYVEQSGQVSPLLCLLCGAFSITKPIGFVIDSTTLDIVFRSLQKNTLENSTLTSHF